MKRIQPLLAMTAGLVGALILNASASAQDALGAGNALDSNLSATGGRFNAPRPQENFRDRNLVITGNVAGGRQFRDRVGYGAEGDFRDRLGTDDIFSFQRDSAYSNPSFFQLGNTFEQLRFGQGLGLLEIRRPGSGASSQTIASAPNEMQFDIARLHLDRANLASASQYNPRAFAQPRVVGSSYTPEGLPLLYSASPLRGMTIDRADQTLSLYGLTPYDGARLRQDVERGLPPAPVGGMFQTPLPGLNTQTPAAPQLPAAAPGTRDAAAPTDPTAQPQAQAGAMQDDYGRILSRVIDRYSGARQIDTAAPESLARLGTEYDQLRAQLSGQPGQPGQPGQAGRGAIVESDQPAGAIDPSTLAGRSGRGTDDPLSGFTSSATSRDRNRDGLPTGRDVMSRPGEIDPARTSDRDPTTPLSSGTNATPTPAIPGRDPATPGTDIADRVPRPADPQRVEPPSMTLADFGLVLRHGQRITRLWTDGDTRFNDVMKEAEQFLRNREYLTAERRFDHALRFTTGHPLATAGMAHAQMGGGLYLSASLSLRQLFSRQPEMIDATYAPELLPPRQRLDEIVIRLRELLAERSDMGAYGLMLAYIGRQIEDRAMIQEGLSAMAQADAGNPLLPLLRSIWLGAAEGAGPSATTPPAAATPVEPVQPDPNK